MALLSIITLLCVGRVSRPDHIRRDRQYRFRFRHSGALDFELNPGPLTTQAASLQILNFMSTRTLAGNPSLTGDVAGTLPSTLTFTNGTAFNDYFTGFTYGSALSFEASLGGPA
jgi:hypothetical protein